MTPNQRTEMFDKLWALQFEIFNLQRALIITYGEILGIETGHKYDDMITPQIREINKKIVVAQELNETLFKKDGDAR